MTVDSDIAPNDTSADDLEADEYPEADQRRPQVRMSLPGQSLVVGLPIVAVLVALAGWLGWRVHESHQVAQQRELFLQVGRQGALNLTTIDWHHPDADVQRILSAATGTFYDVFSKRSQPFIDVVKQAQSTTAGTITLAGLESASDTQAQVLVAVSVSVSNAGAPEQNPRAWRMRISVQKVGHDVKVSNVEFVP
ncbi:MULTISPECIES: mammalian cell entry protein [unclassified Mycobacterium]|uniref:mammalian cell entry protein n=1 Tax=unclassified Mycobacterium TaxID=2642494 RepID=UPI0029C7E537|nr:MULTISPECIES: mammalian cell entry protein [unclassified Mycobacterium]